MYSVNKILVFCITAFATSIIVASDCGMVKVTLIASDVYRFCLVPIEPKGKTGSDIAQVYKSAAGLTQQNDWVNILFVLDGWGSRLEPDRTYTYAELSRGHLYVEQNRY